jgi:molybdopterin-guanine dinucleotide biosynthesis protein A
MAQPSCDPVGVVLAGGASRRLGQDKALLRIGAGLTLLERTVATVHAAGLREVVLSVSTVERGRTLREAVPAVAGLPLVVDAEPGRGPLGALHAALSAFPHHHVLLVACDMPRLHVAALRALLEEPREADAVVPRVAGRDQPVAALYAPACLPLTAQLLEEGRLAMRDLLAAPGLRVRFLDETCLARAGVPAAAFDNVNTPADLEALHVCDTIPPGNG